MLKLPYCALNEEDKLCAQIKDCNDNIAYLEERLLKERDLLAYLEIVKHIKEMEVKRDEKVSSKWKQ